MTQDEALRVAMDWYGSGNQDPDDFMRLILSIVAQPEQEPIGYASEGVAERLTTVKQAHEQIRSFRLFTHDVPLYTAPQRKWVGLTDEEIRSIAKPPDDIEILMTGRMWIFVGDLMEKLKEKNT